MGTWLSGVMGRQVWGRRAADFQVIYEAPVLSGIIRPAPDGSAPRRLVMRPMIGRDHDRVDRVRQRDREWLQPWEATLPPGDVAAPSTMGEYIRRCDRSQQRGEALFMMVEVDGVPVGQFSLQNVHWGAAQMGTLGYWLTSAYAGRGLGASAAATVVDLALGELGLHRVEICVRPENAPSLGLCRRLGFIEEGLRPRYLHIAGRWADHIAFVADRESMPPGGYLKALLEARGFSCG
ncbi:GNAT family N-acetyltransferase [Schaalia suimastitidis]|uniref:GNAT family N-acetyltransferase n=1 Tax=Schaalia suimastitidis TaxID=121163 RepID=UPI001F0AAF1C|nr:GNAT family protein [Schaalia suimastitidis]